LRKSGPGDEVAGTSWEKARLATAFSALLEKK
jgi:hypothetical protein